MTQILNFSVDFNKIVDAAKLQEAILDTLKYKENLIFIFDGDEEKYQTLEKLTDMLVDLIEYTTLELGYSVYRAGDDSLEFTVINSNEDDIITVNVMSYGNFCRINKADFGDYNAFTLMYVENKYA